VVGGDGGGDGGCRWLMVGEYQSKRLAMAGQEGQKATQ